jgi:hypothetical protein
LRRFEDYFKNSPVQFLDENDNAKPLNPHVALPQPPYEFVAVDGGVINNEPFEIARRYLADGPQPNKRDSVEASKAMILVDPFPNRANLPDEPDPKDVRLTHVVPGFLGMLVDQARFKPEELALAQNDRVFSRFAIVPSRPTKQNPTPTYPIASGILGGFGGFLDRSFRRHDYLLGRRNAQAFLRWTFVLAKSNPLFDGFRERPGAAAWYVKEVPRGSESVQPGEDRDAAPVKVFKSKASAQRDDEAFPIIPLTRRMQTPIEIPARDLPRPASVARDRIEARLDARLTAVIDTLLTKDLPEIVPLNPIAVHGSFVVRPFLVHIAKRMAMKKIDEGLACLREAFPSAG